jgi:hypothetical protein
MKNLYRFVSYAVISLGALLGGAAGHVFGLRAGLTIGVIASPLPRMRQAS